MAIDIAGFITYLKDHAVEHGFHVHDERHFLETYSLRQSWEVDMHPDFACDGPLDLNVAFNVEPRVVLSLEDQMIEMGNDYEEPEGDYRLPLLFNWALPPLAAPPELVMLAAELAGIGGIELPIEVSSVESTGALSTAAERRLSIVGRRELSLVDVMLGREQLCETLERSRAVSEYLIEHTDAWQPVDQAPD
ncbi:MAG: hypothetical protein PVI35_05350 [Acidimicrobiia bacterium]|jgi:hypothetical protein